MNFIHWTSLIMEGYQQINSRIYFLHQYNQFFLNLFGTLPKRCRYHFFSLKVGAVTFTTLGPISIIETYPQR